MSFAEMCRWDPKKCFLGSGAYGDVYRGKMKQRDGESEPIDVAVKFTKLTGSQDKLSGDLSFVNEKMIAQYFLSENSQHTNILQFYGSVLLNMYTEKRAEERAPITSKMCGVVVMELVDNAQSLEDYSFSNTVESMMTYGTSSKTPFKATPVLVNIFKQNTKNEGVEPITTSIMLQLLSAIEFLESKGVVHMDLKVRPISR